MAVYFEVTDSIVSLAMYLLILLFSVSVKTESRVMLSPSGGVFACPGSHLSFRCSTSLDILEWNITVGALSSRRQLVTDISRFDLPLVINSHSFNVTRDSADRSKPIISTLTTSAVTSDLNGTTINCTDVGGSESSTSVATINVITPDLVYLNPPEVNNPEAIEFRANNVTVIFQWTREDGVKYSLSVVPQTNYNVAFQAIASAQIQVLYNIVYNVSIKSSLCGQVNATTSFLLNYVKCAHPLHLPTTDSNLRVDLDSDPALAGTNASFTCPNGRLLIGSSKAKCTGNGYWEPDPRKIECKVNCGTPPLPSNGVIIPYTSMIEGARAVILCRDIHHSSLLRDNYTVFTCTEEGQWEPNPSNYCTNVSETVTAEALSQNVVIALAVTASSIVLILIFFAIGIICGCFCRKCMNEKSDSSNSPTVVYEEVEQRQNVELNQNMAYGPARMTSVATTEQ